MVVLTGPGIKDTSLFASPTIRAGVHVSHRDISGPDHQVPAVVVLHELEVMAAAGAAVAECIDLVVRLIQGKVDKAVFIGFPDYFRGLRDGNWACPPFFDGVISPLVE